MKRIAALLLTTGVLITMTAGSSSGFHHRIVFEASGDEQTWDGVLNNVENIRNAFAGEPTDIEVVAHGKGLGLLLRKARQADRVTKLAGTGVTFAACENAMRRQNVTRDQLVPAAITVPSGVAEVVRKQEAGWSYIKAGG